MSNRVPALTPQSVELLLDLLESRELVLCGAAAELHEQAASIPKRLDLIDLAAMRTCPPMVSTMTSPKC